MHGRSLRYARLRPRSPGRALRAPPGLCRASLRSERPRRRRERLYPAAGRRRGLRLGGRLPGASVADAQLRARLALGLFAGTAGELRAFVATAAQARGRRLIAPAFARARQAEARALLRATLRLRTDLRRILATRRSFAR